MLEYGADALRFWAAVSKLGEDLNYQEKDLVAGKRFVTKLLNASRFVFMNLEDYDGRKPHEFVETDSIFLKNLNILVSGVTESFQNYEYSKAKQEIENFFWKDFCDNYLEIVKYRIYNEKGDKKISAQYTLYNSLLILIKLIAPIMPFITEEIYQTYFKSIEKDKSVHVSNWPQQHGYREIKDNIWPLILDYIFMVRKEKASAKKSVKAEIIFYMDKSIMVRLKDVLDDLKAVTNAKEIKEGEFRVEFI